MDESSFIDEHLKSAGQFCPLSGKCKSINRYTDACVDGDGRSGMNSRNKPTRREPPLSAGKLPEAHRRGGLLGFWGDLSCTAADQHLIREGLQSFHEILENKPSESRIAGRRREPRARWVNGPARGHLPGTAPISPPADARLPRTTWHSAVALPVTAITDSRTWERNRSLVFPSENPHFKILCPCSNCD